MTYSSSGLSRRSFLIAAAGTLALPALASCSPAPADPNALRIAWWGGEARNAKMNQILDLFERQAGVTFRREFASYDAYWERFATQVAARNLPDLLSMTEQQVGDYASNLADLLPSVRSGVLDLSSWDQRYIDAGMVDGRLVQLFLGGTVPSFAFNRPALTAAGFPDDPNTWTWAQFSDAATAISRAGAADAWGASDAGGVSQGFDTFLHQRGKGQIVDGTLGWEAADLTEYLTLWKELRDAGGTPPIDVTTEDIVRVFEDRLIVRGGVVLQTANHNHVPIFQRYVDDELRPTTYPLMGGGTRAAVNAGTYVSLAATSQAQERAVAYLQFFVNTPEVITLFEAEYGGLPAAAATELLLPTVDEPVRRSLEFYDEVSPIAGIVPVWPRGGLQLIALIRSANESVAGGASPGEAAGTCFDQARAVVA